MRKTSNTIKLQFSILLLWREETFKRQMYSQFIIGSSGAWWYVLPKKYLWTFTWLLGLKNVKSPRVVRWDSLQGWKRWFLINRHKTQNLRGKERTFPHKLFSEVQRCKMSKNLLTTSECTKWEIPMPATRPVSSNIPYHGIWQKTKQNFLQRSPGGWDQVTIQSQKGLKLPRG